MVVPAIVQSHGQAAGQQIASSHLRGLGQEETPAVEGLGHALLVVDALEGVRHGNGQQGGTHRGGPADRRLGCGHGEERSRGVVDDDEIPILATGGQGTGHGFLAGIATVYHLELGQLLARNPRRRKEAEGHLTRATEVDPSMVEGYLAQGMFYAKAGRSEEAAGKFREALRWDPDDMEAAAALKELEQGEGGLLRGLFKG